MNEEPDPRNRWQRAIPDYRGMNSTLTFVGLGRGVRYSRAAHALPEVATTTPSRLELVQPSQSRPVARSAGFAPTNTSFPRLSGQSDGATSLEPEPPAHRARRGSRRTICIPVHAQ